MSFRSQTHGGDSAPGKCPTVMPRRSVPVEQVILRNCGVNRTPAAARVSPAAMVRMDEQAISTRTLPLRGLLMLPLGVI